jgi:hypothetical protein
MRAFVMDLFCWASAHRRSLRRNGRHCALRHEAGHRLRRRELSAPAGESMLQWERKRTMHHSHLQPGTLWPAILQRTAHALQGGV